MKIRKIKKQKYKLILFDLDGTLANSMEHGLAAMNLLRFLFGYKKLDKEDPNLRLVSGTDFVKQFLKLNFFQSLIWIILLKFLVSRSAPKIKLYSGVPTMLKALKKNFEIGLVTSAPQAYARTILKNGKIDLFDFLNMDVAYLGKDQSLKSILKKTEYLPNEILYIGDELRDGLACAKVGIPFLAVNWGKDHEVVFEQVKTVGVVSTPKQILGYVF